MSKEKVYYVDENDVPTGEVENKLEAHDKNTRLHAAFSCYLFNKKGQFLVTRRAHSKKVWHGVWTNSCCGHPGPSESRENAIKRRLADELGMSAEIIKNVIPDYVYKTPPYNGIIEHEYCPVFVAVSDSEIKPNPEEVVDYKWVDWDWYVDELSNDSTDYSYFENSVPKDEELGQNHIPKWSWWCKDQLKHLQSSDNFNNFLISLKPD